MLTELPALPEMRPLAREDYALFRGLFAAAPPQQSEFTFTNLFLWREAYALRVARLGEAVLFFSWRADPEDSFLFPPLGEATEESVRAGLRVLAEAGHDAKLARVTRADLERLGVTEDAYEIQSDRDQWDYVYLVGDLIALSGNRYHDKRNHLEQFLRHHQFAYRPLTPELAPACQELHDRWCDEKHCDLQATLRAEVRAVKEVLGHLPELGVTGGCIAIGDRVEAYTLGELLDPETVVIHLEKANAEFHGLYQAINQQFLAQQWAAIRFVNREQDLGIPGLRKAKESYHPHHLVEKFEVRLK
jgi:hypothetical protein